jgi:1-acyl-sn-glycerol-3-phosphate acyltransferase
MATTLPLFAWLTIWRALQRYHRYTVEGLEHLDGARAVQIVGYHGRPWAWDMCMLMAALHDRLGYYPHGIVHRGMNALPGMGWFVDALGCVTGDGIAIETAVARGEHVITTPGGAREGCRSFLENYRVDWGYHTGYVRLALKYNLHIVPVGAAGADGTYIGLNNPKTLAEFLGLPPDWAWIPWFGIGPLGLFPMSPPFPVKMRQLVGAPIDPYADGHVRLDDREGQLRVHRRVVAAVQGLIDHARHPTPATRRYL